MTDLNDLLAQVRNATEPDRELDLAIWNACNGHPSRWHESFPPQTVVEHMKWERGAPGNPVYTLDDLTASVDASLALANRVLPEHDYLLGHTNGGLTIHAQFGPDRETQGYGETLPLAILAALLKALQGEQQ